MAAFGPAGITPPARQAVLVDKLYLELGRADLTLGEAIRRAKAAALEEDSRTREVVDGFLLFGDPALRLPWATPVSPSATGRSSRTSHVAALDGVPE